MECEWAQSIFTDTPTAYQREEGGPVEASVWAHEDRSAHMITNNHSHKNVVFLDADTMVYQPAADDLFALPECSYAPGAAESFNSGLFTVSPSMRTFNELVDIVSN